MLVAAGTLDSRSSLAAGRAAEVLRYVIRHFLPRTDTAPYRQPHFWERAYFGLQDYSGPAINPPDSA